jgi:hypothetical protein
MKTLNRVRRMALVEQEKFDLDLVDDYRGKSVIIPSN